MRVSTEEAHSSATDCVNSAQKPATQNFEKREKKNIFFPFWRESWIKAAQNKPHLIQRSLFKCGQLGLASVRMDDSASIRQDEPPIKSSAADIPAMEKENSL